MKIKNILCIISLVCLAVITPIFIKITLEQGLIYSKFKTFYSNALTIKDLIQVYEPFLENSNMPEEDVTKFQEKIAIYEMYCDAVIESKETLNKTSDELSTKMLIAFLLPFFFGASFVCFITDKKNPDSLHNPVPEHIYLGTPESGKTRNPLVIGRSGTGKVSHPWDYLEPCPCGCKQRPLMLYDEDELYYCGGPTDAVYIKCPVCGRHTEKKDIHAAFEDWNTPT